MSSKHEFLLIESYFMGYIEGKLQDCSPDPYDVPTPHKDSSFLGLMKYNTIIPLIGKGTAPGEEDNYKRYQCMYIEGFLDAHSGKPSKVLLPKKKGGLKIWDNSSKNVLELL